MSSSSPEPEEVDLRPVIQGVIDALGGFENGTYVLGFQCLSCLKDLKKLWRRDESDDERTIARVFYHSRVLPNDLVPILLETAGKGNVEDKRAISCADLVCAMTWPIDLAEELKELDDVLDRGTDYTTLLQSHLQYKAALLQPGVMNALFGLVLPPLSKPRNERTERDGQIVNIVLHLIRNLAFIRDLPYNTHASADQNEFASLQSKLVVELRETHMLEFILTVARNQEGDELFERFNTVVLEILYLLFRGVGPSTLGTGGDVVKVRMTCFELVLQVTNIDTGKEDTLQSPRPRRPRQTRIFTSRTNKALMVWDDSRCPAEPCQERSCLQFQYHLFQR